MRERVKLFVFSGCVIGFLAVPITSFGQTSNITTQSYARPIYGAQTPDLIPDIVAYRFVLLSLRLPDSPTEKDIATQRARLRWIGFSPTDVVVATNVIADLKTTQEQWETGNRNRPIQSTADRDAVRVQQNTIIQNVITVLFQQLSLLGQFQFDAYVKKAKTRMFVLP